MTSSDDIHERSNFLHAVLVGSLSASISTLSLQPFDLLKTRIQECSNKKKITHAFRDIIKKNGIFGLWRGSNATLIKTIPGVGMYFGIYHTSIGFFDEKSVIDNSICGFSSRIISTLFVQPLSTIKTRIESGKYNYSGVMNSFTSIYKCENITSFYSGSLATIMRDAPFSGLYLLFYKFLYSIFEEYENRLLNFSVGVISGIMATAITHPADVIKTRQQVGRNSSRISSVLIEIGRNEGIKGFFSGITLRSIRRGISATITWSIFDSYINK